MRAPPRCRAGLPPLQGAGGRRSEGRSWCARCDSDAHCRRTQRRDSCHWSTGTWSRHPVPTRVSCLTGAGPQPCAAAWLPELDSNQRGQGSGPCWGRRRPTRNQGPGLRCRCESAWLPASRARARGGSRTRIRQVLRLAALPVGCTRASCAARGSNSAPQIKSLMHHHNACSA